MIIRVTDPSHAGESRRQAAIYADRLHFSEPERGRLAIAVTEIATNLIKHAGSGSIMIDELGNNGTRGVRILALDKGPGIRNIAVAMGDGHSTSGTAGNGLGAIKRLSDSFDIYSSPENGTAILADFWLDKKMPPETGAIQFGVISVPVQGEQDCGDGWGVKKTADATVFMVVDGLGHGILASEAAREAERTFAESHSTSPTTLLHDAHDALKKTRGAAMAVASMNVERNLLFYAGIGNIGASIVTPDGSRGMASHNGTLGHHLHKLQEFTYPWNPEDCLVMYSDGLNTRWDLKPYPGIWNKHPALIAGLLYRDFSRERDDVTVLVVKRQRDMGTS